jgi:hypothetical protein
VVGIAVADALALDGLMINVRIGARGGRHDQVAYRTHGCRIPSRVP